jgi:hypothetical protein
MVSRSGLHGASHTVIWTTAPHTNRRQLDNGQGGRPRLMSSEWLNNSRALSRPVCATFQTANAAAIQSTCASLGGEFDGAPGEPHGLRAAGIVRLGPALEMALRAAVRRHGHCRDVNPRMRTLLCRRVSS